MATVFTVSAAYRRWVLGDAAAMAKVRSWYEGRMEAAAEELFDGIAEGGPLVLVTPERVAADALGGIGPDWYDDLDAHHSGTLTGWWEAYLDDSLNALAHLSYTVNVDRGRVEIKNGVLTWEGDLAGEPIEEETEVPENIDTDALAAAFGQLGLTVVSERWRAKFLRGYGMYGSGEYRSVYEFTVRAKLDLSPFVKEPELLKMAAYAIAEAESERR